MPATVASASGLSEKIEKLAETISIQSVRIEDLRTELVNANSWRKKLPDWIVGGIIGAAIGGIVTTIVGAD